MKIIMLKGKKLSAKKILWVFILLAIIYAALNFFLPPESSATNRYQLTASELRLLRFTVVVPIIIISFISYYGYDRIRKYAETISNSPEGKPLQRIVHGLLILALWLPITSILSNLFTYAFNQNPDLTASLIILRNYINLAFVLYAFYVIYQGSQMLVSGVRNNKLPKLNDKAMTVLVIFSGFFAYLTLINPVRQFPSADTPLAAYYLPDIMIILTIIIPYIFVFYWGFLAVQNIYAYREKVRGVLFKQALSYVANGIGMVVLSLMAIRYFTAMNSLFSEAGLKILLLVVYILIILIAAGYVLIARGAKKLQRIEEV